VPFLEKGTGFQGNCRRFLVVHRLPPEPSAENLQNETSNKGKSMIHHKPTMLFATALLIGLFAVLDHALPLRADEKAEPPAKNEHADKAELFAGKIKELNLEARWLKVADQTYLVGEKTHIENKGKAVKLADLHVGMEVHGLAKKEQDGKLVATMVKVGPKPNEISRDDHRN
jgi:hypothetical protein